MKTKYSEFLNENKQQELDMFNHKLFYHLHGGNIIDSIENINIFKQYFGGEIPNNLKYDGTVYRIMQTKRKDLYDFFLKTGFNVFPNQKYYGCSKTLDGIEIVKQKTLRKRYKYFVIFKIYVTKDDVLFDVNKMIDYMGLDEDSFKGEQEVLIKSDKIPSMNKENIIDFGVL